jgi:hypothetical protein
MRPHKRRLRHEIRSVDEEWTFGKKPDGHFGVLEHEYVSEQVKEALRQVVASHRWAWHGTLT